MLLNEEPACWAGLEVVAVLKSAGEVLDMNTALEYGPLFDEFEVCCAVIIFDLPNDGVRL